MTVTRKPSRLRPACSHWESEPVSSPTCSILRPLWRTKRAIAAGSLSVFPSLIITPPFVDHADARTVQRYVDPDKELHGGMLLKGLGSPIVGSRDADGKTLARSAHLYRQAEIFAREGVNLETSTLSGWVGATAAALQPLIDTLAAAGIPSHPLPI